MRRIIPISVAALLAGGGLHPCASFADPGTPAAGAVAEELPAGDAYQTLVRLKQSVAAEPDAAEPYFYLAVLYSRMRQHDLALAYVERALAIDDESSAFSNLKGAILVELKQYRKSLDAFQKALLGTEVKEPYKVWRNMGYVHLELNAWNDAVEAFQRALALEPRDAHTAYALGKLYRERNALDKAIEHLTEAVRLQPGWASAHAQLGIALARAGQADRAVEALSRAVEIAPESSPARYNLAQTLLRQGRVEEGRREMAEYERLRRRSEELEHRRRELTGFYQTALARLEEGELEETERLLRKVLDVDSGLAPAHYTLGFVLLRKGDYDAGIRCFEKTLQLDPLNGGAYFYLAGAYEALGDARSAVEPARRAVVILEENAEYQGRLGQIYVKLGRFDEALEHLRRAVELEPDEEAPRAALARALVEMRRLDEAEQAIAEGLEAMPSSGRLYSVLGALHQSQGRIEAAAKTLEKAVPLVSGPEAFAALTRLAVIYVELNRPDDAVSAYRQALELQPEHVDVRRALAELYLRRNRLAQAEAELDAGLAIAPGNVEARALLARVHLEAGRLQRAAAEARAALEADPDHLQARYALAMALVRGGDAEAGRRELAEYQRLLDTAQSEEHRFRELMAFNQEALLELERSDHAAAVAHFRQAVERFPELALPHVTLGLALIKLGESEEAILHLSEALKLGFDYPELHRYLAEQYAAIGRIEESEREMAVYARMVEALRSRPRDGTDGEEGPR